MIEPIDKDFELIEQDLERLSKRVNDNIEQHQKKPAPATSAPPATNKRGPYKIDTREQTIKRYESEVRDAIDRAIRQGKIPDQSKIDAAVGAHIRTTKGVNVRTFNNYLPATERKDLFGKLCQQVLELKNLSNK